MKAYERALSTFGVLAVAACAAPEKAPAVAVAARDAAAASSVRVHFLDHLSFGARVENVSLLLDGVRAYESDGASLHTDARVTVRPGAHTLAVVLEASEPCGLFDQPRTTVVVEATTMLRAGAGAASIAIDLWGTEATRDPLRTLGVRFTGHAVVLGAHLAETPPTGCEPTDRLCAVDALAERAQSRKDPGAALCLASKRAEIRRLKDVIDDSYATVARDGTTTGAAQNAQLRARYAEERIQAIAIAAEACGLTGEPRTTAGIVELKVERSCPGVDVTAGLDRF